MQMAQCIEATGVGFMFAPVVHPAMKARAPDHHSRLPPMPDALMAPLTSR
jgi:anthranilate phosphoribosyltransferase